jgi:hypothetical protein
MVKSPFVKLRKIALFVVRVCALLIKAHRLASVPIMKLCRAPVPVTAMQAVIRMGGHWLFNFRLFCFAKDGTGQGISGKRSKGEQSPKMYSHFAHSRPAALGVAPRLISCALQSAGLWLINRLCLAIAAYHVAIVWGVVQFLGMGGSVDACAMVSALAIAKASAANGKASKNDAMMMPIVFFMFLIPCVASMC